MSSLNYDLAHNVAVGSTLKESSRSGNSGYDPSIGVVTLHGNSIAGINIDQTLHSRYRGARGAWITWNFWVEWIDLCGYPTSLTLKRLKSLDLPIYKKDKKPYIKIVDKEFELIENGRIPVGELLRTIISNNSSLMDSGNVKYGKGWSIFPAIRNT